MKLYTGIDVGIKGGIVTINDKLEVVYKNIIPSYKGEVDWIKLKDTLSSIDGKVAIEDVHSIYGMSAKSNFNFGYIKGYKIACLSGKDYILVQPKVWQKTAWLHDDIVYKKLKPNKMKDTKATSLNAAQRIFPGVDWRIGRQRVQQDGLYDAGLIAYWLCMEDGN